MTADGSSSSSNGPDVPFEVSKEEYAELQEQAAQLSTDEAQLEWMEASRHGEVDVVRALAERFPDLTAFRNKDSGNTALHMAAANGHLSVVRLLMGLSHEFTANGSGNTPLHWAASNGRADVVQFLTQEQFAGVDVLAKNDFGRSALTEGFSSENEQVVKALLEHDSATEEKLLATSNGKQTSVTHKLFDRNNPLLVRELAMINADNPFADAERPDQDTTGLSIWSASLVLARWLTDKDVEWQNATVVELGAGCGVPGLAVASGKHRPSKVYVTDLNPATVENLKHNVTVNKFNHVEAMRMDWADRSTWPKEQVDRVIGSDLVYQKSLVPLLSNVVTDLLKPGGIFYYVAPDTGRDGLETFIEEMKRRCPNHDETNAPKKYHDNPLVSGDDEECFLHFQELSSMKYVLYEFRKPES